MQATYKWVFKFLLQRFQQSRLKAAFRKFYGRYNDQDCPLNLSLGQMLSDMFQDNLRFYTRILNRSCSAYSI